jgi:hypothetical protein
MISPCAVTLFVLRVRRIGKTLPPEANSGELEGIQCGVTAGDLLEARGDRVAVQWLQCAQQLEHHQVERYRDSLWARKIRLARYRSLDFSDNPNVAQRPGRSIVISPRFTPR